MTSQPIHYQDCETILSGAKAELLEALLQPEEDFYLWNPAEPEAELYFAEVEQGFILSDWQEEDEINSAASNLFKQLHQCWAPPLSATVDTLKMSLSERFATFVPQAWLEAIATKAQQVFSAELSVADQLVMCIKPLLPNWAEDDLLVLARPLAYAMRSSSDPTEEMISSVVQRTEWTELTQMEQARLSLAVAHSALVQLKNSTDGPEA
ncbi:MAG TPA: hypothetical protein V6D14_13990 [Coleofasciculaceae cyanobacterium]|jgi:hypothetical protein